MTTAAVTDEFRIDGPLPTGITVLEASAGTGKTYAIAALATRYVASGVKLEELLLVTFTRMATGELRDRVRERLVATERGLEHVLAGGEPADHIVELLADGPRADVALRRQHLARAIADFDSATIETTHGFCQEVLGSLGIAADADPDATFVEDITDLIEEVVDDLYVRRFMRENQPRFGRAEALKIGRIAVDNPGAPIEPSDAPDDTDRAMRARLADAVRRELKQRKERLAVMTYDDLLTRLDGILANEDGGERAAQKLRDRYSVVLVDEFQDTDPIQWDIMQRAFGDGSTTLVLIGDPKQAIYAFRGADVFAYLNAREAAGARATLGTNRRSDAGLLRAYDALFDGAMLGHEGIEYLRVTAAPANEAPRLHAPGDRGVPLRVRVVHPDEPGIVTTQGGFVQTDWAREHVARDVASDIVELLRSGAEIETRAADGSSVGRAGVRPGDIAVLVRTHRNAAIVRDALEQVDVPAVINGAGSVFATAPARDWLRLLKAIERPTHDGRARATALTPFIGWSAGQIASASDLELERIHDRLHHWARVLRLRGVASLTETVMRGEGVPERVLRQVDGERRLTDLRHIGQLLHAAAAAEQMGVAALTSWLHRRIEEAESDTGDEERSRRLESDAAAVQVLTIHRSKGLEFPIVYAPFLWETTHKPREPVPIFFHDPASHDNRRTIDVGLDGPDWKRHEELHEDEERGEDLRLMYVALTRARHQAVVWWAGTQPSRNSPLGRLLFAREPDGYVRPRGAGTPPADRVVAKFQEIAAAVPGCVHVDRATPSPLAVWTGDGADVSDIDVRSFDRALDWDWRRTSYTAITAAAHDERVASEPEEVGIADEPDEPVERPVPLAGAPIELPLAAMPAGAQIGTFVHRVFEAADFAAADLDAELVAQVAESQARGGIDVGDPALVVAGLRAVIDTPLGDVAAGIRLRDLARGDRLDELGFEMPLVGGDRPSGQLTLTAIAAVLRSFDALPSYAERLADPALTSVVSGYLTGSIDLVMRLPDGRYAVADYKTNWLAPSDAALAPSHYRPAALAAEMDRAHYHLQALLYMTALHRFLRWRLPGYDPDRDLGGVMYLFVRGMTGGADGTGIHAWSPPAGLIPALSDVLEGGGS